MLPGWKTIACPRSFYMANFSSGLRNRGAPKKRYKDTLKKSLGACNISHLEWTTLAEDLGTWRPTISKAASSLRILPEVCHRGKMSEEEKQCSHTKPRRDLYLLSLQPDLSIPHRPDKSRACLQETWTSSTWSSLAKQSHDDDFILIFQLYKTL